MKKIAIIGAGLTGITLARIVNSHFTVTLFEKSRGVGGRMATRRSDGFAFDHGAQFFSAKSPLFKEFIEPLIALGYISRWDARFVELNRDQVISARIWDQTFPHYVGNPSMNDLCQHLAAHLNVRLNTKITAINHRAGQWQLEDEHANDLGVYDWVIVTAPAEQAAQLLPSNFKFIKAVRAAKMLGCYSLMLGFKEQPALNFDAALVHNADISWISVNSSKPGRAVEPTLLVNSTNAWAQANLQTDSAMVQQHLLHELKQVTGLDANSAVCQILQRWLYANIPAQNHLEGLIDWENHIAACGDWCIQGRVEAAFLIGYRVAQAILMPN